MNDIEAHIARTHLAANRIEIGAVVVEQAACIVNDLRDLEDAALENPQRRWIGEHDAGGLRTDRGFEGVQVEIAVTAGRQLAHDAAAHRGCRRIRAVCRIGYDDLVAVAITPLAFLAGLYVLEQLVDWVRAW